MNAAPQQLRVGRLVKAHGLKGALKLELYTDDPAKRFTPGARFTLQVPDTSPWHGSTLTLTELRWYNGQPVAFFAYPDKPSRIAPEGCNVIMVATPAEDQPEALARLADAVGATQKLVIAARERPAIPTGALTPETIGAVVGALLPENAIVCDEGVTTGRRFFPSTHASGPMDWLQLSGGAIGVGIPMATGAAVACPDVPVCCIIGDGAFGFHPQEVETAVRNKARVIWIVLCDRQWGMVKINQQFMLRPFKTMLFKKLGEHETIKTDLGEIRFDLLAQSMGAHGERVSSAGEFRAALQRALDSGGAAVIHVDVDPVKHMWAPGLIHFKKMHEEPAG